MKENNSQLKIQIVTPAPPGSLSGNRVTAKRWQNHLRELGHQVRITEEWNQKNTDVLIALHAFKSHTTIVQFKEKHPELPVILVITGTDLYRDLAIHTSAVKQSMALADQIVVLQAEALKKIPLKYRHKARIIYQSVEVSEKLLSLTPKAAPNSPMVFTVIGHLRQEKDPFRALLALGHIDSEIPVQINHLGRAMSDEFALLAKDGQEQEKRYKWLGGLPHQQSLRHLKQSSAMIISSWMEGGAHVVSEAIALGVPVLASNIPGNIGLLGKEYSGYFKVGNEKDLAKLMKKAYLEPSFLKKLQKEIRVRKKFFKPSFELASIHKLIKTIQSR